MNKSKNNFIKTLVNILLVFVFLFSIFYDAALSNINFPFLTTVFFILFMIIRFVKPIFR